MEAAYIDRLRVAYEEFFATYGAAPVLTIDTNALDFVHQEEARASIFDRIRGALGAGPRQPALPGLNDSPPTVSGPAAQQDAAEKTGRHLAELQQLHRHLDAAQPLTTDPLLDFITLQETIGMLAGAVARRWLDSTAPQAGPVVPPLRDELAAVLASLVKLANDAGVDLEDAYGERLRRLGRATQTGAGGDGEHT
jgi:deoxyguanosine kinase